MSGPEGWLKGEHHTSSANYVLPDAFNAVRQESISSIDFDLYIYLTSMLLSDA